RCAIRRGALALQLGRRDETLPRKILIPVRLRLSVPERLLLDLGSRDLRDPLEAQDGMTQIGDRGVAVLKIETLQELLRIVGAHPFETLTDRVGRPAVASQCIGT